MSSKLASSYQESTTQIQMEIQKQSHKNTRNLNAGRVNNENNDIISLRLSVEYQAGKSLHFEQKHNYTDSNTPIQIHRNKYKYIC